MHNIVEMPVHPALTIAERIRSRFNMLTRAERRLADTILENYPMSGLGGIAAMANAAGVSLPTVARLEKKIGFNNHRQIQSSLRSELRATLATPIIKHNRWAEEVPETHILNRFADAVIENMRYSLRLISPQQFNKAAVLLADTAHAVHIAGERLTRPLADYFCTHLQVIRGNVTLLSPGANTWPPYILNIKKKDVAVIFDIRRYEQDTLRLAEQIKKQGGIIVLFTDQWGSPVAKHAAYSFHARIEAPSAWDSSVVSLLIAESLISAVANASWKESRKRIKSLENLYNRGGKTANATNGAAKNAAPRNTKTAPAALLNKKKN